MAASLVVAACDGGNDPGVPSARPSTRSTAPLAPNSWPAGSDGSVQGTGAPTPRQVRLQLHWARQAQFAGYLAAIEQGYYDAAGIRVTIVDGGPEVRPHLAGSAPDGPEFTVSWVPSVLRARAEGTSDLVDIAQVFQRSGTLSIAWKDAGVTRPAEFEGKRVGVMSSGNELEVVAGAIRADLDPATDLTLVTQDLTMDPFVARDIAVAQATIYDGYAQVLEATNPTTGGLYQPTDLDVINWNDEGTAMLHDAVFARASWLEEDGNEVLARDFLEASFRGWIHCRDEPDACVRYTVESDWGSGASVGASPSAVPDASPSAVPDASPSAALGRGHQAWMLNEVNPLIWPSPAGIGVMETVAWEHTVSTLVETGLIDGPPDGGAYRMDLAQAALGDLADIDTTGESFVKGTVEISPGGS